MPSLVRKLIIYAAVDGLVLQPLAQRGQRPGTAVTIDYKTHAVKPLLQYPEKEQDKQIECYGVIGLLKVSSYAYLITVSRRQQVAQIFGKPVYVITGVSVIPLGSQAEAQQAINHTQKLAKKNKDKPEQENEDIQSDTESTVEGTVDNDQSVDSDREVPEPSRGRPSVDLGEFGIVKNVIEKKGAYGVFADKWFSKRGWTTGSKKSQGMSNKQDSTVEMEEKNPLNAAEENASVEKAEEDTSKSWPETPEVKGTAADDKTSIEQERLTTSLIPKLVQTTKLLLSSRIFHYSYEQDITNRNIAQSRTSSDVALYKQANPEYFWNEHLTTPFVEAGFTEYVLPIMQGFVGQCEFEVKEDAEVNENASAAKVAEASSDAAPLSATSSEAAQFDSKDKPFLITIISRRSVRRNGLRYLRRGIDEDGNVANAVETEQILSTPDWDIEQGIHSFVQCRGSIPLFFSQIPYSFKPVPNLLGTPEANQKAMKKHFASLQSRYGSVHCISLIDRHGTEPKIGQAYEDNLQQITSTNSEPITFNWWEFHAICRGMKFENVSLLVSDTDEYLNSAGWTSSNSEKKQTGIIRTNCMDCLDRTNVVQSAFGLHILDLQLSSLGHATTFSSSTTSTPWFNNLWADNGDAISRSYTGTSALKGDYTRTRKRNVLGALNDFSLTLSRYYQNLFDDFFAQAAIDYLLGIVTEDVFFEFENTMTTADPAIDIDRARQSAIHGAADVVVERGEELVSGYALASPAHPNTLRTYPFEETLLLLTESAVYFVRFDWATEKVQRFERVGLERLVGVTWGAYVTETNTKRQMDGRRNVGFVVRYRMGDGDEGVRVFTRSLETGGESAAAEAVLSGEAGSESPKANEEEAQATEEDKQAEHNEPNPATKPTKTKSQKPAQPKDAQATKASTFKDSASSTHDEIRFYAFKALPVRSQPSSSLSSSAQLQQQSERDSIQHICGEIGRFFHAQDSDKNLAEGGEQVEEGSEEREEHFEVVEGDIISPEEARRSTGYLETLGYSLKKLVWG